MIAVGGGARKRLDRNPARFGVRRHGLEYGGTTPLWIPQ
jgi:hypothetical protein